MLRPVGFLLALLSAVSCGGMDSGLSAGELDSYRSHASDLAASVTAYRAAASSMSSAAECSAAVQPYAARGRLDLDAMGPMADRMDSQMSRMGRMSDSDLGCGMKQASAEFARHLGVACAAPDMAQNRAEALRHSDAMQGMTDHLQMRGAEAGGMMMGRGQQESGWTMSDGGMMDWGHSMPGCSMRDGGMP